MRDMTNGYSIFKFRRPLEEEITTLFFLPCKDRISEIKRDRELKNMTDNGYICAGFVNVDKETYLNARLDETVRQFCENEKFRMDCVQKFSSGSMSLQTFTDTMRLVDDFKWTCLTNIYGQVRRLLYREEFDVRNEIALQLFDGLNGNNDLLKSIV